MESLGDGLPLLPPVQRKSPAFIYSSDRSDQIQHGSSEPEETLGSIISPPMVLPSGGSGRLPDNVNSIPPASVPRIRLAILLHHAKDFAELLLSFSEDATIGSTHLTDVTSANLINTLPQHTRHSAWAHVTSNGFFHVKLPGGSDAVNQVFGKPPFQPNTDRKVWARVCVMVNSNFNHCTCQTAAHNTKVNGPASTSTSARYALRPNNLCTCSPQPPACRCLEVVRGHVEVSAKHPGPTKHPGIR